MSLLRRRLIGAIWLGVPVLCIGLAGVTVRSESTLTQAILDQRTQNADLQDRLAQMPAPVPVAAPKASFLQDYPDVAGTLRDLEAIGAATNSGITSSQAETVTEPGKQSFRIAGTAPPAAVCKLLSAMESGARLMVLQSGKVEAADESQVRYEFVFATFHRTEAGR